MEQLSSAELIELAYINREYYGNQFQYWVALTFAVITASYAAAESLSPNLKRCIAALYVVATFLFLSIYLQTSGEYNYYLAELESRGVPIFVETARVYRIGQIRFTLWVFGSLLTLWFLLHKSKNLSTKD